MRKKKQKLSAKELDRIHSLRKTASGPMKNKKEKRKKNPKKSQMED